MQVEARGLSEPTRRELGNKVSASPPQSMAARLQTHTRVSKHTHTQHPLIPKPNHHHPHPTPHPRVRRPQISTYRSSLEGVSSELTKAKAKYQRSALLGTPGGANGTRGGPMEFEKSQDQRTRMMNTTDKLRGGTETLDAAHSRLEETIEVGA